MLTIVFDNVNKKVFGYAGQVTFQGNVTRPPTQERYFTEKR